MTDLARSTTLRYGGAGAPPLLRPGPPMTALARSTTLRYGGAIIAVFLATIARLALDPIVGDLFPFAMLLMAVLVVAGYAGRGPGLLTVGLGAAASAQFLLPPDDFL